MESGMSAMTTRRPARLNGNEVRDIEAFVDHQGALYDWQGILGFIAWPIPDRAHSWACHEACAAALGHPSPSRTDPAALCETLLWRMS